MSYLALIDEEGDPIDSVKTAATTLCTECHGNEPMSSMELVGTQGGTPMYGCLTCTTVPGDTAYATGLKWPALSCACSHYWRPGAWTECQGDGCKRCGGLRRFPAVYSADPVLVILHEMGYASLMFEQLADGSIVLSNDGREEYTLPPLLGAGSDHLSATCAALLGTL